METATRSDGRVVLWARLQVGEVGSILRPKEKKKSIWWTSREQSTAQEDDLDVDDRLARSVHSPRHSPAIPFHSFSAHFDVLQRGSSDRLIKSQKQRLCKFFLIALMRLWLGTSLLDSQIKMFLRRKWSR